HCAGQLVPVQPQRDEARVAASRGRATFDDPHAAAGGDQLCVDGVDAILGEALQQPFDSCCDEQVDVVLPNLSFELELDRSGPSAEQLPVEGREALGQIREWAQVGQLLR